VLNAPGTKSRFPRRSETADAVSGRQAAVEFRRIAGNGSEWRKYSGFSDETADRFFTRVRRPHGTGVLYLDPLLQAGVAFHGRESAMNLRLHLLAMFGTRQMLTACAGLLLIFHAGCCAVPGRYYGEAPLVGADECATGSCGVGGCRGCSDGVIVERPGLLTGVFRVLGIGPSCGDCGPRYWGDWGGEPATCEACDDYGNWTGGGAVYSRSIPSQFPAAVDAAPHPAPCPHCRQAASQQGVRVAPPSVESNPRAIAAARGGTSGSSLQSARQQPYEGPKARVAAAPRH